MMKAILTIEFDKPSDLHEAVSRLRGDVKVRGESFNIVMPDRVVAGDATVNLVGDAVEKHTADVVAGANARKPRSDAGQPRAPYKPRAVKEENASPAAPATPAAGEQSTPAAAGADAKAPTFDDVKDALQKVHDKAGLGMDSCVKLLQSFGTNRVTGIKPEQFAQFVASARALVGGK